jgi:sugar/nucleoside kinase (ribokinase family)
LKLTERFVLGAGGCAANTAACLRRLNRTVAVLGKVGPDFFGDFVIADLERLGIDAGLVQRSKTHHTSETFILNVQGQDRRYLHYTGANADFSVADVDPAVLDSARVLYVGGYLGLPGLDAQEFAGFFRKAKQKSLTTVLDVVAPVGATGLLERVEPLLPYTDYFLPNQDEAQALTGQREPRLQAEALAKFNPDGAVVITRGPKGALTLRRGEFIETKSFPMQVVDGSGAGDAFAAGLITGLLEGWPLEEALRFASAVGASCTRAVGCTAGVFHFEEAVEFIEAQRTQRVAG